MWFTETCRVILLFQFAGRGRRTPPKPPHFVLWYRVGKKPVRTPGGSESSAGLNIANRSRKESLALSSWCNGDSLAESQVSVNTWTPAGAD